MADSKPHIFTCPECAYFGPGTAFSVDDDNKLYSTLLGDIGDRELARKVQLYLSLFRPRQRKVTASRARKLLGELVPLIVAGRISRDSVEYAVTRQGWMDAIEEMLRLRDAKRLDLPLETHGYLLDVIVSVTRRAEGDQRRHDAAAETEREQQRRDDSQARGGHRGSDAEPISAIASRAVRRVGPDGIALAPGQRPDETQADFFARRRREG